VHGKKFAGFGRALEETGGTGPLVTRRLNEAMVLSPERLHLPTPSPTQGACDAATSPLQL
jgi:hypothetical protein